MLISKSLAQNLKIKKHNIRRFKTIIDLVKRKILEQGTGCFHQTTGVAYFCSKTKTRDPICHLLNVSDFVGHFGPISEEAQKPIVRKLVSKFGINIGRDCERVKFISFLQAIQDAHDSAFDAFHDTPQPMSHWESLISQVEHEYCV
jgi:hypothetical protein